MRYLRASRTDDVEAIAPLHWRSTGQKPGFVFDIAARPGAFACFLLNSAIGEDNPKISFDQGGGFTDVSALRLKSFPFAFYHLPTERVPAGARLRFSPSSAKRTFRFVAFQTSNAFLVAVLHYLFNLRYQGIGLFEKSASDASLWRRVKDQATRIAKFFGDVDKGRGLRVQEGGEPLADLKLALSLKTLEVQRRMAQELSGGDAPLLTFVTPVYDTPPNYLRELVDSFALQAAPYAELLLCDDGSTNKATIKALESLERPNVRVLRHRRNRGIAATTNAGIAAARGRWIAFIDHDDAFVDGAAAMIADAILHYPGAIFFYTDEMVVDRALKPIGLFCKPAFDSVWLSGANYINHFSVYRRDRLLACDGLREDREGSQDYDLLLRYLRDPKPGEIVHIPFVAYLWRREEGTYSHRNLRGSVTTARLALRDAYAGHAVEPARDANFHRIRFETRRPLVSVIIPNRDSPKLIEQVIASLRDRTAYRPIEILVVDNGTTDARTLAFYRTLTDVTVEIEPEPFNFARMCNRGARLAKGDALLFLNNDIETIEPDWLDEMVECLSFSATGIVGARLLYPNGTVQHNGVIVGLGEAAGHWYTEARADDPGPMGRFAIRQTLSAVTAACMLVTRTCFDTVGGFDEDSFAIAYNDVDFCLRARHAGLRTIWTPFATLVHHESVSRGSDAVGSNNVRFQAEMARLKARHGTSTMVDDAYSPLYDRRDSRPHVRVPDELPALRPNVFV